MEVAHWTCSITRLDIKQQEMNISSLHTGLHTAKLTGHSYRRMHLTQRGYHKMMSDPVPSLFFVVKFLYYSKGNMEENIKDCFNI